MKKLLTKIQKNMENKITIKEILLRLLIFVLVVVIVTYSGDEQKQWLNVVGFTVALLGTFYLRKHFFPFMTAAIACYFIASITELSSGVYDYTDFTRPFWNAGNVLLPIGVVTFILQLIFKYKIVERDDS